MNINKKQIAAYALMPQVFPRFRELIAGGFSWFAYLIAHIYYAVRLLPAGHAYLNPENKGKYGVRHVVAAAAKNLKFELKYIDQLLIFGIIIAGVVLLVAQIVLVLFGLIFSQAQAGMFETLNPESDNAFMLLDFVFGVPGFFGSCALGSPDTGVATIAPCTGGGGTPPPAWGAAPVFAYHAGLHTLLEFYSWSLLFVGILIFLYFIVIVLAETASTGVPLGARFNTAWAPIRLLVAIGLLIPIAYGLNSGQYLTLAIAKLGSGLATNGWLAYNDTCETAFTGAGFSNPNPSCHVSAISVSSSGGEVLLPKPQMSDASPFVASMQLIRACEYAYMKRYGFTNRTETIPPGTITFQRIRPWLIKPGSAPIPLTSPDNSSYEGLTATGSPPTFTAGGGGDAYNNYEAILQYYDYGDIRIRFGAPRPEVPPNYRPDIIVPYCGEITLTTTAPSEIVDSGGQAAGAWHLQARYLQIIMEAWHDTTIANVLRAHSIRYGETLGTGMGRWHRPCMVTAANLLPTGGIDEAGTTTILGTNNHNFTGPAGCTLPPSDDDKIAVFQEFRTSIAAHIDEAWTRMLDVADAYELTTEVRERGWAAAGMWYNRMAFVIGREFDAAMNLPYLTKMPAVMAEVRRLRGAEDYNVSAVEVYNPRGVSDDEALSDMMTNRDYEIAWTLYNVYKDWQSDGIASDSLSIIGEDRNILTSVMHGIFGTERLLSVLEEESFEVHPMAQLIAIGKDLVNSTLVNVIASVGFSVGSGIFEASGQRSSAGLAEALSGAFSTIALVGLTAGFLLYYVLPFMPFLYFFFAVGTWVKTIFEAMVGVPLWALAHIRIDREGLPGDAAANGYFLLLEIFIRPILIVFSLIASFIIFGALVRILHEVFGIVVQNITGFNEDDALVGSITIAPFLPDLQYKRSIIDEFFFTIIYVMTMYMVGLSCFKLIDNIPQSILRWAGAGVSSFGDKYQDPAESLTQYAAIGGYVVGRQALQGVRGLGKVAGQTGGQLGRRFGMFGDSGLTNPMFPGEANIYRRAARYDARMASRDS